MACSHLPLHLLRSAVAIEEIEYAELCSDGDISQLSLKGEFGHQPKARGCGTLGLSASLAAQDQAADEQDSDPAHR